MDEPTPEGQVPSVTPARKPAPHGHQAPAGCTLCSHVTRWRQVVGGGKHQGRGRELAWGAEDTTGWERAQAELAHPLSTRSFLQSAREGGRAGWGMKAWQ